MPLPDSGIDWEGIQNALNTLPGINAMRQNAFGAFDLFDPSTETFMYSMYNYVINEDQNVICSRAYDAKADIELLLMWLTKPNQTEHENFTATMENVLRQMIKYERDIKRCYTFYGDVLYGLNDWLKEVNVAHQMALGDTYDFEYVAQVRFQREISNWD